MSAWTFFQPTQKNLRVWQLALLLLILGLWHLASRDVQLAFFVGEPMAVLGRIWSWFMPFSLAPNALFIEGLAGNADIYLHLGTTLLETVLAFVIGTGLGLFGGLWLALAPSVSAILDPYIKAANSMPRVILAPIFALWFGLGIWSKVALAVTLVFFVVFFNVYQGVKEVSPVVLANARMLGANQRQLLRTVYLPSATSWVFSSLHTSVGLAFVGAVVGEYLGSARGVGYLILQAEGTFDVNTVFAGIVVLTAFALILDSIVGRIEQRLMKWQPGQGETEKLPDGSM
jgi:NitT/TauT family transport system permease protein